MTAPLRLELCEAAGPPDPALAPRVKSRQKLQATQRLTAYYMRRSYVDHQRANSVGAGQILRVGAAPMELDEKVLDEVFGDVLAQATSRVRASVLRFLALVATAWVRGKDLSASRANLAELCGWAPRTGDFWIARLLEKAVLQVDATFYQQPAGKAYKHTQNANLYRPDLLFVMAIRASMAKRRRDQVPDHVHAIARQLAQQPSRFTGDAPASEKERLRALTEPRLDIYDEGSQRLRGWKETAPAAPQEHLQRRQGPSPSPTPPPTAPPCQPAAGRPPAPVERRPAGALQPTSPDGLIGGGLDASATRTLLQGLAAAVRSDVEQPTAKRTVQTAQTPAQRYQAAEEVRRVAWVKSVQAHTFTLVDVWLAELPAEVLDLFELGEVPHVAAERAAAMVRR